MVNLGLGLQISRKEIGFLVLLVQNALVWLYMLQLLLAHILMKNSAGESLQFIVWATFNAAIILSIVISAVTIGSKARRLTLAIWIIFGAGVTLLPLSGLGVTPFEMIALAALFGYAFGIGVPSGLGYFADLTRLERRGAVGGFLLLLTFAVVPLMLFLSKFVDIQQLPVAFFVWRTCGLLLIPLEPKERTVIPNENLASQPKFPRKYIAAYFFPWLLFNLTNFILTAILGLSLESPAQRSFQAMEFFAAAGSAFVAGILADHRGRKQITILGFAILGFGYALSSVLPVNITFFQIISAVDGIAWGIFLNTFIFTIWADISPRKLRERYYAMGPVPIFLSGIILLLITPLFASFSPVFVFTLNAFFLFAAMIPLLLVPETLPSEFMERRRLKDYLKKAKKIRGEFH